VDIASACDIRLAASNSIFGIMVRLSPLFQDIEGEADV
jgi:hypothetical protein